MSAIGLLSLLATCSYEDIKRRRVGVILVLCFGILGIIMHIFKPSNSIESILGGMLIGILLIVAGHFSREKIGKGDGLVLMVTGIYLGFWNNLILLWGASMAAGLVGIVYIMRGRRNAEIPFIPFLLGMYLIILLGKGESFVS